MSTPTPFDTPAPRRPWTERFAARASDDVATSLAGTSLSDDGGVVQPAGITYGKSVVVVSDASPVELCGARVGSTKICFKTDCSIQAHRNNGGQFRNIIADGIYVLSGSRERAFNEPIGELSLMDYHADRILSTIESIPAKWTTLFNSLTQASSKREAEELEALRLKAKSMQTPGKRVSNSTFSSFKDTNAFSDLLEGEQWETDMNTYEKAWKTLADDKNLTLPPSAKVAELLLATAFRTAEIEEAVKEVIEEGQDEKSWVTTELNGVALRTTDLEKILGDPIGESASVWTAVSALTTEVSDNSMNSAERFAAVNVEFEEMFGAVTGFQDSFQEKFQKLEHRIDDVELGGGPVEIDSLEVSSLKLRMEDLLKQRLEDRVRIDSLESRLGSDTISVVIGEHSDKGPSILRSAEDLRSYMLMSSLGTDLNFGGFADVYVLLLRLENRRSDTITMTSMLKNRKDVGALNLSLDEAMVIHSHHALVPTFFGRVQGGSRKSELSGLPTHKSWRCRSDSSGLADVIDKDLRNVEREVEDIIRIQYGGSECVEIKEFAISMLRRSAEFIRKFVPWVDDTYAQLKEGGNTPEDVWWLITRVVRAIFEEYLAPMRSTPINSGFRDSGTESSTMIWGAAKTNAGVEQLLKQSLKDHPIVQGAFTQWLVGHSGRKEADMALEVAAKATIELATLRSLVTELSKTVMAAEKTAKEAKKTADRLHNNRSSS
jgi:hypothetical protein